jgi:hypothetical protein
MKRGSLVAAVILFCVMQLERSAFAFQTPATEDQVKATFLFNFAQFIKWPRRAFTGRYVPFTMCTTGDSLLGVLEKTVEGQKLNGRRIAVRRLGATDSLRNCQLIYVGRPEAQRSAGIITAADRLAVLTVGDSDDFINVGGMIRFTEVERRVRFEINPDAAARVSLQVSSRLLRLADITRPRAGTGLR